MPDDFADGAEREKMREEADRLRAAAERETDPKKRADMIIEAKGLEFLDLVGFHQEHGPEGVGFSEEEERLRCLLVGVRLDDEAQRLAAAAAAWAGLPKGGQYPDAHKRVVEAAETVDDLLNQSANCGNERNGYLSGEFGDMVAQARSGNAPSDLAERAEGFAKELRESAKEPEVALGIEPFSRRVVL